MTLSKGKRSVSVLISLLVAVSVPASGATAAVFTSTPPETVTEGEGPVGWAFESDAPGTMWGRVTWKVSTEPEWNMCGGSSGTVTLEGLAAGTYWVEIADEVDLAFAGESLAVAPFARCSEPHSPAPGPLHPVTLSTVTVVPQIVLTPTAAGTVVAVPAAGPPESSRLCLAGRQERREAKASIRRDLRRLRDATTKAGRDHWRGRLIIDRESVCAARSAASVRVSAGRG